MADNTAHMVSRWGSYEDVPIDQVQAKINAGYHLASADEIYKKLQEDEYGDTLGVLEAGAAGAARGLTFGLSDVALTKTGAVSGETLQSLQEVNPVASTVGEVGGVVAGAALSGGSGVVGDVAKAASVMPRVASGIGGLASRGVASLITSEGEKALIRKVLGTAISKATGGAVEGALYGAGQLVSEEAIAPEPEITASHVMSTVGLGALLGGALSGTMSIGSAATKPLAEKAQIALASKLEHLPEQLKKFALKEKLRAIGFQKPDIKKSEGALGELESHLKPVEGVEILEGKYKGQRVIQPGDTQEQIAEKLAQIKNQAIDGLESIKNKVKDSGQDVEIDVAKIIGDADGYISSLAASNVRSDRLAAARLSEELAPLSESIFSKVGKKQSVGGTNIQRIKSTAKKYSISDWQEWRSKLDRTIWGEQRAAFADAQKGVNGEKLAEMRNIIERNFMSQLDGIGSKIGQPDLQAQWAAAKKAYRDSNDFARVAASRMQGDVGLNMFKPSVKGVGIADYAGAVAHGGGGLPDVAMAGIKAMAFDAIQSRAASTLGVAAEKLAGLSWLNNSAKASQKLVTESLNNFLGITGKSAVPATVMIAERPSTENTLKRMKRIKEISNDQYKLSNHISTQLNIVSKAAPNTSAAIMSKVNNTIGFLASKVPTGPQRTTITPLSQTYKPTSAEIAKWNAYYVAAENPSRVILDLANGKISPEGAEVLRTLHPQLYKAVALEIQKQAARLSDELPYDKRIRLSILYGVPVDSTMRPDYLAWVGESAQQIGKEQQPGFNDISGGSLSKSDMADGMAPPVGNTTVGEKRK